MTNKVPQFESSGNAVEIVCYLVVQGFTCPDDEITSALGVVPTKTWVAGDLVTPFTVHRHKDTGWQLRPSDVSTSVDAALLTLLDMLPKGSIPARLPSSAIARIHLGLTGLTERPSFTVSPVVLKRLADTEVALSVDPYDLTAS